MKSSFVVQIEAYCLDTFLEPGLPVSCRVRGLTSLYPPPLRTGLDSLPSSGSSHTSSLKLWFLNVPAYDTLRAGEPDCRYRHRLQLLQVLYDESRSPLR